MRLNEVLLKGKATLKGEGEDWYISREVEKYRGQEVETLYLTDEFGTTTLVTVNVVNVNETE